MRTFVGTILFFASAVLPAAEMIEVRYQDSEANGATYLTRLLVTENYLRMDEGSDDGDFLLLDRKSAEVLNVQRDSRILMVLQKRALPEGLPQKYRLEQQVTPVNEGTMRVRVLADGKLCSDTVAAKKLFPEVASALGELNRALAYTHLNTYLNTPADLRQDCDLVHLVWQADLPLLHGLPLEGSDYSGRVRRYLGGENKPLNPALFKTPEGYFRFELPVIDEQASGSSSQPAGVQDK